MGNVGSVLNMLRRIGVPVVISRAEQDLLTATHIILPGVGAFDSGMCNLKRYISLPALERKVREDRTPLLGICLGMQMLGDSSEEGQANGLGWIPARTVKLDVDGTPLKLPNMGWSGVEISRSDPLLADIGPDMRFYFVHSYHLRCENASDVIAHSHYNHPFAAVVRRDNICGVQFHPEKSHRFGMQVLANFTKMGTG